MRAGLTFFGILVVFMVVTDLLLYFKLLNFRPERKFPFLFNLVYFLVPIFFTATLGILFVQNKGKIDEQGYFLFTQLNGFFLIFYIPKVIYLVYSAIYWLVIKAISLTSWRKSSKKTKLDQQANRMTRAAFLGRVGVLVAGAPFLSLIYGMAKGRFNFHVKEVELAFDDLPKAFDGYKIVQISDIHLGNFNKEYYRLHQVTELVNQQGADLLLMTGDMVNNFAAETDGWETVFSKMKAREGKFSILGNHDYGDYSRWPSQHAKRRNFDGILAAHKRFGFRLMRNESLTLEKQGQKINLLGVENWGKPPFPQYGDLHKAMENIPESSFNILMSHDPDHWDAEVKQKNIHLTLAGHTHGMQFGVKFKNATWSPAKWKYKYWDGLYKDGQKHLYVNRGLGFIGLPMRVGMPPEITAITLRCS